jgi:hypothetical protein
MGKGPGEESSIESGGTWEKWGTPFERDFLEQ